MTDDKSCPCLDDPDRRATIEDASRNLANMVAAVGNDLNICPTAMIGVIAGVAARLLETNDIRELSELLRREGESLAQRAYLERVAAPKGRMN